MNCQEIEKHLPLYSGGDLNRWKRIIVKHHLDHCENCRTELARFQGMRSVVTDTFLERSMIESQDRFWEDVLFRLPKEKKHSGRKLQKDKRPLSAFHKLTPALVGIAMIFIMILIGEMSQFYKVYMSQVDQTAPPVPVVEHVNKPGVTVMTFQTDDPKVTIVWFFEEESKL